MFYRGTSLLPQVVVVVVAGASLALVFGALPIQRAPPAAYSPSSARRLPCARRRQLKLWRATNGRLAERRGGQSEQGRISGPIVASVLRCDPSSTKIWNRMTCWRHFRRD